MDRYEPLKIEQKWQKRWEESHEFEVTEKLGQPKMMLAEMFPYPSGAGLHVGHVRNFTIVDVLTRFYRQQGLNVMRPFGYDTFGLPAENYAIKTGTAPQAVTAINIENFRKQAKRLGYAIDWSREINTSSPEYYKWTQWCFLKLYEKGLAYQKESYQWWCPEDQTVLANEQVENGKCWRCGHEVEKKKMKQWFFKITEYADELLDEIDNLEWPEKIKTMQRNWIGRSVGAEIDFNLVMPSVSHDGLQDEAEKPSSSEALRAARPSLTSSEEAFSASDSHDGLHGEAVEPSSSEALRAARPSLTSSEEASTASFSHDDSRGEAEKPSSSEALRAARPSLTSSEEAFSASASHVVRSRAIRVFTTRPDTIKGATFVVLAPEYAGLDFIVTDDCKDAVLKYKTEALKKSEVERQENKEKTGVFTGAYALNPATKEKIPIWVADYVLGGYGTGAIMAVPAMDERDREFAEKFDLPIVETELVDRDLYGTPKTSYKMRDWLISRQRYWGCPIPIAYDKEGNPHPIPEEQLPVLIPEVDDYRPDNSGRSALAKAKDWLKVEIPVKDPKTGEVHMEEMTRETDTLDGYACSSWYLWRYASPRDDDNAWAKEAIKYWEPVDFYVGADHAVAHLLYIRFWCKFFADQGYLPFREPVKRLLYNGYINAPDGKKMSKSKGNVIDPLDVINDGYGADTLRTYEMFIGPYDMDAAWDPRSVGGVYRFLNRCYNLLGEAKKPSSSEALRAARPSLTSSEEAYLASVSQDDSLHGEAKKPSSSEEASTASASHDSLHGEAKKPSSSEALRAARPSLTSSEEASTASALVRNKTIKKVTEDIHKYNFNTAVAALMEYVNELYKVGASEADLITLAKLLKPFAPHLASEMLERLDADDEWPKWDEKYLVSDTVTVVVQINGKLRAKLEVSLDDLEDEQKIIDLALADKKVQKYTEGGIKKQIFVKKAKLLNLVV